MANVDSAESPTACDSLVAILSDYTFRHTSEEELQRAVAQVLQSHEVPHEREARLDGLDRVDFLIRDSIAIEIKVDGSLSLVTRQIHRYLQCERVEGIVLLTSRRKHLNLPETISGKPVRTVWISSL